MAPLSIVEEIHFFISVIELLGWKTDQRFEFCVILLCYTAWLPNIICVIDMERCFFSVSGPRSLLGQGMSPLHSVARYKLYLRFSTRTEETKSPVRHITLMLLVPVLRNWNLSHGYSRFQQSSVAAVLLPAN